MNFNPIPRQKPYCSFQDFWIFLKMFCSNQLISGSNIKRFEDEFAKIYKAQYALSMGSCRSAFALIIESLGIQPGDEVILPALNLPAFANILKFKGIKPVFVDTNAETLNMDESLIEQSITGRTKAIVVVHLFGNACDMERICSIAHKHGLTIIEDCANAFRTKFKDRYVGMYGDIACFSLGPSKDVSTFGGGMIVTNNKALYNDIRKRFDQEYRAPNAMDILRMLLKSAAYKIGTMKYIFLFCVYPFTRLMALLNIDLIGYFIEEKDKPIQGISRLKFTNFQAGRGLDQLQADNAQQIKRRELAGIYNESLNGAQGVSISKPIEGGGHAYWNYVIKAEDRVATIKRLLDHGIDGKIIDAYDCNSFETFKEFRRDCPVTEKVSSSIMALPVYPSLKESDIQFICRMIKGNN